MITTNKLATVFFCLSMIFGVALPSHASPAAGQANKGGTLVVAKCLNPSLRVYRTLFRQAVADNLKSRGFSVQGIEVDIKASSPRTAISLANVSGLTSINLNKEETGFDLITNGDLSANCVMQATLSIKAVYVVPANKATKTPATRKTLTSSHPITIMGAFN